MLLLHNLIIRSFEGVSIEASEDVHLLEPLDEALTSHHDQEVWDPFAMLFGSGFMSQKTSILSIPKWGSRFKAPKEVSKKHSFESPSCDGFYLEQLHPVVDPLKSSFGKR